jgi:hypothetical protein
MIKAIQMMIKAIQMMIKAIQMMIKAIQMMIKAIQMTTKAIMKNRLAAQITIESPLSLFFNTKFFNESLIFVQPEFMYVLNLT